MADNQFLRPRCFYKRSINPVGQYIEQNAFYLHRMSGKPIERCKKFVLDGLNSKRYGASDPLVDFFERNDYGDREVFCMTMTSYLKDVIAKRQILAPTFTTYKHPDEEESLIGDFTDGNVKRRSVVKKEGQLAESEGKMEVARAKDNEQANTKTYINSLSGALGSSGSFLQNETGHNTLTSVTRTMTSIGNALNESMIGGNRHYRNHDVALDNVIYRAQSFDKVEVQRCMDMMGMHYPTPDEVMSVIGRSLEFYAYDNRYMQDIRDFVETLTPLERAAVVYTQDLYHIRVYNDKIVRDLIDAIRDRNVSFTFESAIDYVKKADHSILNYAHQILIDKLAGQSKDYDKLDPELVQQIASVAKNVEATVIKYKPLIDAFFLTEGAPGGTAYIAGMVRRVVNLSDTDSTMFSIDEWVQWYFGELTFTPEAFGVAGAVMFFATETIAHGLAIFSANMGVADKHLFSLQMKPEFVFPVFAGTLVAKHYFTFKLVKEGMVYAKPIPEIKGVHLKNSAAPASLVTMAQDWMVELLSEVMAGKLIDLNAAVKKVADLERTISASLLRGELEYYKRNKIKPPNAYTQGPLKSPYQHHNFWEMVMAHTYGDIPPPTYSVIKIPTTIETNKAVNMWLETIENEKVRNGFVAWMSKHNKVKLPTMYVSVDFVKAYGLPKEIIPVINTKKIVLDLTGMFRIVLESLGYCSKKDWLLTEQGY